jgi:hypothetical protein
MMKTKDEALEMAIEALLTGNKYADAINACKEALEPEPMTTTDVITCKMVGKCCMTGEALEQPLTRDWKHTIDERIARDIEFKNALEQPTWQGLTDEERYLNEGRTPEEIEYAIAIEQALKDKNGKV